jgi:hypothetical protein
MVGAGRGPGRRDEGRGEAALTLAPGASRSDGTDAPEPAGTATGARRGRDRVPWWWAPALAGTGALLVRVAVHLDGNGYRPTHVHPSMWHLLEARELAARPFAPLWDVHTSPPLFSTAVAVLLRWSPLPEDQTFRLAFTVGGVFAAVALCEVLRAVGCRWWIAALTAVVALSKPAHISAELYVSHEAFVTPMVVGLLWAVAAYARRPSLGRYGVVLTAATLLTLTRALFHPLWLVLVIVAVAVMRRPPVDLRRVAAVGALPLVLVVALMAKNEVRFGTFSLSSWAGMNWSRAAVYPLGHERVERMIAAGELSPQARVMWFSPYEDYERLHGPCDAHFGTSALDAPVKAESDAGVPAANYNAACFVPVYEQALEDSVAAVRHAPGIYARTVGASTLMYLTDTRRGEDLGALEGTTGDTLNRVHDVINLERYVRVWYPNVYPLRTDVQLTSILGIVVVLVAGARAVRRRRRGTATDGDVVVVVAALTVAFVTVVGVGFDAFENGRFREPLDPLLLGAVLGGGIEAAARALDRRRARPS